MNGNEKYKILQISGDKSKAVEIEEMVKTINSFQFEIESVFSLTKGFEAYFSSTCHVVLLDLDLPDSHGYETVASAYDAMPNIPIVALVKPQDNELGQKALKSGAQDYLVFGKFNRDQLLNSIQYAIGRKEMTEKLRRNKDLLFDIFNDAPIIMYLVNEKREIVKINNTGLSVLNHSEKELIGTRGGEALGCFFSGDSGQNYGKQAECKHCKIKQAIEKTFLDKEPVSQMQSEYLRRKGDKIEKRYLVVSTSYIDFPDEPLVQISISDITELKESQQKIEKTKQRLESMLQISQFHSDSIEEYQDYALHHAIDLTESKAGFIYHFNDRSQEFTLVHWKATGNNLNHGNPYPQYDPELNPVWYDAVNQKQPQMVNFFNDDSTSFPNMRILVVPLFYKDMQTALIGVAGKDEDYDQQDLHQLSLMLNSIWKKIEQKKFENELIKAKEKAEEADRLKSAFLATMSHELRTPLNAVIGFSELLMEEENKDFYLEFATTINQSGKHLLEIIEEVFLMTELESMNIKLKSDLFEVDKLLLKVNKEANDLAKLNNKFDFQIKTVNHPKLNQLIVKADLYRLQQVFRQLVNNAVKFTQHGEIRIGVDFYNNTPVFYVKDTGIGIEPRFKSMIFERFVQVEQALTREFSGIGLGLTISKRIVELMQGKIWIDSEKGKGTTVYFTFPDFILNVLQPINLTEFT